MGQHISLGLQKVLPKVEESSGCYTVLGDLNRQEKWKGLIRPLGERYPYFARKTRELGKTPSSSHTAHTPSSRKKAKIKHLRVNV